MKDKNIFIFLLLNTILVQQASNVIYGLMSKFYDN